MQRNQLAAVLAAAAVGLALGQWLDTAAPTALGQDLQDVGEPRRYVLVPAVTTIDPPQQAADELAVGDQLAEIHQVFRINTQTGVTWRYVQTYDEQGNTLTGWSPIQPAQEAPVLE